MQTLFHFFCCSPLKKSHHLLLFMLLGFCCFANAATYNLTSGSYPPCNTSWSVSGTTYTCNGNGRVTLASGDILTASTTITISANNGFSLNNNTVGSSSNRINLTSTYGNVDASGTNTVFGNITSSSGNVTLVGTALTGTITTGGAINLTGGSVSGLVTSQNQTIITNGANLSGGARGHSGMNFTGGTLSGNFVMTSNNPLTMSAVTMTSGSISGSSNAVIQNGSQLGSASSSITITTNTDPIIIINSTVYGNLTAPNYSTVDLTNGGTVYGTCLPNSTPANACGPAPIPPTPMNCTDGTSSGITGYYYNNRTLTEPSTGTRSDAPIDFSWGGAAPGASGINADNFSVRWNGFIRATQTGAYRFQTESDDGVRLYINDTLIIDRWNDHSATTDTSTDINLVAGNTYKIRLEYYENGGDAVIRLRWRLPGSSTYVAIPGGPLPTMGAGLYECTPAPKPPVSSCATNLSAGITGNYFNNQTLTNPVTRTRLDGPINFDWGTGVPGPAGVGDNNFSVRWEGYIHVTQSGVHRFQTNSDDGVRLTVNGDLLIDQWNDHSVTTHTSAAVNLIAGNRYPIKLEYYENGGFAVAQLRWQTPGSASYVAIPSGVNASPITAPGLYECVTTPAGYLITHSATGITCAAESVTVTALNSSGVAYNPPAGTVVTMSTAPATGVWVGGTTFTFTGSESSFTKYLRQTTPGNLTIRAESATASATSPITFLDTALRIQHSASVIPIPTQIAGVEGNVGNSKNAIAKVISTNPKTGVCEAVVASRTLQMGIGFTCNNPTTCAGGQFLVNGAVIAPNNNGASVNYNNVNVTFNASGEAPITLNYSDVGQVTLHGRLKIDALGNNPELTIFASSSPFVVKPYTLRVTGVSQATSPFKINPGTTNTGNGFIPAGEKFIVSVQSFNALGVLTSNFGNEILVGGVSAERNKIQLQMGCPERVDISNPPCLARKPDYPIGGGIGQLLNGDDLNGDGSVDVIYPYGSISAGAAIPRNWTEVGSFRLEPNLADSGYLGQGDVSVITPSGVIGRFYPARFELTAPSIVNSCGSFSYMEHPYIGVSFTASAYNIQDDIVQNYDNDDLDFVTAGIEHIVKDLNAVLDGSADISSRFSMINTAEWSGGQLTFNDTAAMFKRVRNSSNNALVEAPYKNSVELGVKLLSVDPVGQDEDMKADKVSACSTDCDAHSLGKFDDIRFGRLRLDSAFGSGSTDLPVNFSTEYWTGSYWAKNVEDSCTLISRNNILYDVAETPIVTSGSLDIALSGGTTTGVYQHIDSTYVKIISGDASHRFTAPGGTVEDEFPVRVNLASYPWLTFDWNQTNNVPTLEQCNPPSAPDLDCSLRARFTFGNYRGHDRVIYWRERFN